ncbi:MAG: SRPBCC domain-containing protein [Gammaproteobacteria bacterium]
MCGSAADSGYASARFDGLEHESSGEYRELVPPERLAMTWRWENGEDPGESQVEIDLRTIADGTELTFTHSRLHDEDTRLTHEEGWNGALNKLERRRMRRKPLRC